MFIKIKMSFDLSKYEDAKWVVGVGVVSAVVHLIVRGLIAVYPKQLDLLLNTMLVVNILLLIYYGYGLYVNDDSSL